jgi:hypothetical protein
MNEAVQCVPKVTYNSFIRNICPINRTIRLYLGQRYIQRDVWLHNLNCMFVRTDLFAANRVVRSPDCSITESIFLTTNCTDRLHM